MGRRRKLNEVEAAKLLELYKFALAADWYGSDIIGSLAQDFGITRMTVYNYLKRAGVFPKEQRKSKNEDQNHPS